MLKQGIGQNIAKNQIRFDLEIIASFIKPNSKVLDIGCSDGELLYFLKNTKNIDGRGIEISQSLVSESLRKGISVIQGDAENDLSYYPDQSFDYAILSQTIQATKRPKEILQETLRVAKFAIISLPNFAHYKNRLQLLLKGTMPVNKTIPFSWYDTPNIHFCSIKDFENLCKELKFNVDKKIFLTAKKQLAGFLGQKLIANFFAEYGIFLISKQEFAGTNQEEFVFNKSTHNSFSKNPSLSFFQQNKK